MHCHTSHSRHDPSSAGEPHGEPARSSTSTPLVLLGVLFGAIGLLYLLGVPSSTLFFGAVLLMCPLMHFLMMGGRGHAH